MVVETVVYQYPANTVKEEKIVTEELLISQQEEINQSLARREKMLKKNKENIIGIEIISKVLLILLICSLIGLGSLLILRSVEESQSKQVTDNVANRVVDDYKGN